MYTQMYELDRVIDFFHDELNITEYDERIEKMYDLISNPHLRVNANDKQWVAFSTQDSENKTVEDAMEEILYDDDFNRRQVKKAIKEVGNTFIESNIRMKPRIPFYIMVLDKLNS